MITTLSADPLKSPVKNVAELYYESSWHEWDRFLLEALIPVFERAFTKDEVKCILNYIMTRNDYEIFHCKTLEGYISRLADILEDLKPRMRKKYEAKLQERRGYAWILAEDAVHSQNSESKRNGLTFKQFKTRSSIEGIAEKYLGDSERYI